MQGSHSWAHHGSSPGRACFALGMHVDDPAAHHADDPIGHSGDRSVVGDDRRRRVQLPVDALQDLEHQLAGLVVERTGRLVAEQDVRPFRDGARDRDALLLAARQLRREMIQTIAQADQAQRLSGRQRLRRNLR